MKRYIYKFFKILRKVVFALVILFICFIVLCMAQGEHPKFFGYQIFRVLTSSMQPAITENTCIIMKEVPKEELKVGDIITFVSEDPQIYGYYNTHRIHEIIEKNGQTLYVTKGDASGQPDEFPVEYSQIAGKYIGEMPAGRALGELFVLLSDSKIYFLFIMLPLVICLLTYIWQIIGFATHRYDNEEDDDEKNDGDDDQLKNFTDEEIFEKDLLELKEVWKDKDSE